MHQSVESLLSPDVEPGISWIGVVVGVVLAMPLALLEESSFDEWSRRLPFSVAVLTKSVVYVGSLYAVFISVGFIVGMLQGRTLSDFRSSLSDPDVFMQVGVGLVLYTTIVFFRQLDRILGPGVLVRYLLGRYHQPRRESRIFMFVDLKSSTMLAERLGHEAYYGLVNEFFRDISGPVLDNDGEIYEYVGDQVVLTWRRAHGTRRGRCIRAFFDIEAAIQRKRKYYLDRFTVVPEFTAGVHVGDVMSAQIGDLKRSLVFNGNVLNTGARIQGQCSPLGKRLVSSALLWNALEDPGAWSVEELGPVALRGKAEPMPLVAFA